MSKPPTILEPTEVPMKLCDGPFNVTVHPPFATITFTNDVPDPAKLFAGDIQVNSIVVGRMTMTIENLRALNNTLAEVIAAHSPDHEFPSPAIKSVN